MIFLYTTIAVITATTIAVAGMWWIERKANNDDDFDMWGDAR